VTPKPKQKLLLRDAEAVKTAIVIFALSMTVIGSLMIFSTALFR
jgi:hypothetical protein